MPQEGVCDMSPKQSGTLLSLQGMGQATRRLCTALLVCCVSVARRDLTPACVGPLGSLLDMLIKAVVSKTC